MRGCLCIKGGRGTANLLIANNTFAISNQQDGEAGQIVLWDGKGGTVIDLSSITIRDNIFADPTGSAVVTYLQDPILNTCTIDNNFTNGSSIYDAGEPCTTSPNTLSTNPLLVSSATLNFHLQASSLAIDSGTVVAQATIDFDGTQRPQGRAFDIGAYEYPKTKVITGSATLRGSGVTY